MTLSMAVVLSMYTLTWTVSSYKPPTIGSLSHLTVIHFFIVGMLNSLFPSSKFVCKIRILFELRLGLWLSEFVLTLYSYRFLYKMAFMWWCSILGPGHILLLLIACFITFCVRRALQQKQHQCIIYCMHCQSLLRENSWQISIRDSNTEYIQIKCEFKF